MNKKVKDAVDRVKKKNPQITDEDLAPLLKLFNKEKWTNAGQYMFIWAKIKGGRPVFGNPGKEAMMELEEEHGLERMLKAWEAFARSDQSRFGWKVFVPNLGDYLPKARNDEMTRGLAALQGGFDD